MHILPPIETLRLTLVPMTLDRLTADQKGPRTLAHALVCEVPAQWPPDTWEPHVFDWIREQYRRSPEQAAWQRYILLRRQYDLPLLIGAAGAFTPQPTDTDAEIGYSILPDYQRKGYATEAVQAIIQLLRVDPRIANVIAHTFPARPASIRVMEKCGLLADGHGTEPGTIRYRLPLPSQPAQLQ